MPGFDISIVTQDGETVRFECGADEDILSAGLRQDIILMSSCREGGCATCKSMCTEGDYELVRCSVQALPPEEEEEGYVLLCRTFPLSDLTIEVPYTSDRISHSSQEREFEAELIGIAPIASNAVRLTLHRVSGQGTNGSNGVTFAPGQFFDIRIPGTGDWRSFSPANLPNPRGDLEFLIRILPDGKFSNYLRDEAQPGQIVQVRGPSGSFCIRENGLQPRYFVAGGTGLAPVVAMVRQMVDRGDPQETRLYFGVNKEEEVFFVDELVSLTEQLPNLSVQVCVMQPGPDWHGESGTPVQALRRDLERSGTEPDLYLCGPPGMIDATYKTCLELGIPKGKICTEKFLSSGPTNTETREVSESLR
jgi:methane monooxygenase component C